MDEQENILQEIIKKSQMTAQEELDYKKLKINRNYLVPFNIIEDGEDLKLSYNIQGLKESSEITKEEVTNQYQFLINLSKVKELMKVYKFEMTTENIYYDENFLPYIKLRDIYSQEESFSYDKFLFDYKCFVGGTLSSKYSVQDIANYGLEVLKKDKYLSAICNCESEEQIIEQLRNKKITTESYRKQNQVLINKGKYNRVRVISLTLIVILLAAVAYTGYHTFFTEPYKDAIIAANQAYINKDYVDCIEALEDMAVSEMDSNTKYILAISYSQSETFKKEEIQNILAKLTPDGDVRNLEYWIHIGRLDMTSAQDIAKALSDDKLLIYAYMKEMSIIESDTTLTGKEKEEQLSELEGKIESLGAKYELDSEDSEETSSEEATDQSSIDETSTESVE